MSPWPADPAPPPAALPPETSGRFRCGTDLAARLLALGYSRELGFHQFLYPGEHDTRAILKFLLDKMPPKAQDATGAGGAEGPGGVNGGGGSGGARGRPATAAERAAVAVGAALRKGSGLRGVRSRSASAMASSTAPGKPSGPSFGGLKGALKTGLAAVAAAAAKDAQRAGRPPARPFWSTRLTVAVDRPKHSERSGDAIAFTSQAPHGYLAGAYTRPLLSST